MPPGRTRGAPSKPSNPSGLSSLCLPTQLRDAPTFPDCPTKRTIVLRQSIWQASSRSKRASCRPTNIGTQPRGNRGQAWKSESGLEIGGLPVACFVALQSGVRSPKLGCPYICQFPSAFPAAKPGGRSGGASLENRKIATQKIETRFEQVRRKPCASVGGFGVTLFRRHVISASTIACCPNRAQDAVQTAFCHLCASGRQANGDPGGVCVRRGPQRRHRPEARVGRGRPTARRPGSRSMPESAGGADSRRGPPACPGAGPHIEGP